LPPETPEATDDVQLPELHPRTQLTSLPGLPPPTSLLRLDDTIADETAINR
jgi:hypothetical protein